jgi:hypothetical protein
MRNANELGAKVFDVRSVVALILIVPAVFWWSAIVISLAALTGVAAYLGSNLMQLIILVICPLTAVIVSMSSKTSKIRWLIATISMLLAALAFIASNRII